jgi:RNA polymerase sigma factor (sigma-70 family)
MVIVIRRGEVSCVIRSRDELTDDQGRLFDEFVLAIEPRLRRALVARLGSERGREATAEALAWAWEHRSRLGAIANPVAFLYRVGQSRSREAKTRPIFERPSTQDHLFDPRLARALSALPERQRVTLLLVEGAGWTHVEVAKVLGIRVSTVQKHVERGRERLRRDLRVESW